MEYSVSELASMLIPSIKPEEIKSLNRYGGMDKLKRIFEFENKFPEMRKSQSIFDDSLRKKLVIYLIFRNRIESGIIIPSEDSNQDDKYIEFLQAYILERFCGRSGEVSEFDFFNAEEVATIYQAASVAMSVLSRGIELSESTVTSHRNDGSGYVYLMHNARNGYHKIGMTRKEPKFREKTLQSEEPEVELVFSVNCPDPEKLESYLHEIFADKRVRGEWFDLDENDLQEIFEMSEES